MHSARRDRGWIGLVGLLIALVIVALLAQKVLKTYGLMGGDADGQSAARKMRGVGGTPATEDATLVAPTPTGAIERAKGVESAVQEQAQDMNKRIDDQAK